MGPPRRRLTGSSPRSRMDAPPARCDPPPLPVPLPRLGAGGEGKSGPGVLRPSLREAATARAKLASRNHPPRARAKLASRNHPPPARARPSAPPPLIAPFPAGALGSAPAATTACGQVRPDGRRGKGLSPNSEAPAARARFRRATSPPTGSHPAAGADAAARAWGYRPGRQGVELSPTLTRAARRAPSSPWRDPRRRRSPASPRRGGPRGASSPPRGSARPPSPARRAPGRAPPR